MSAPKVHYFLRIADQAARRFGICVRVDDPNGKPIQLRMPAWVPGSYVIRDFAGHVSSVEATQGGQPVDIRKSDKSTWTLTPAAGQACEINYQVYAPELTVRTNDISHNHAFVNPAGTFFAVVGRESEEATLSIEEPSGWRVSTSLEPNEPGPYRVPNYDILVDSPMEIGPHDVHRFEVAGKPHELVVHGEGNFELNTMVEDTRRICETLVDFFGDLPSPRYLFILLLTANRGGGLEHADSSVLAWPRHKFRPLKEYRKFLTLVSHEYFHLWNVKRIRPEVLLEFDYSSETYTRLLWIFEGITSYFSELLPVRTGVYPVSFFLELLAEHTVNESSRGGRVSHSLAESSFDSWIKLYRPTPDSYNSQVNYYEKGQLVAMLLDLHLREASSDQQNLDEVMRHLYREVYQRGRGVPEDGFADEVRAATGIDISGFLEEHVLNASQIDMDQGLAKLGLRLREKELEEGETGSWLGATVTPQGGNQLAQVCLNGPAHDAGLMAGDEIIALDGVRVSHELLKRVGTYEPNETARYTAFRRDELVEGTITFVPNPYRTREIVPLPDATAQQRTRFESWSNVAWDDAFDDSENAGANGSGDRAATGAHTQP